MIDLSNKTATERANIKATEIAKLHPAKQRVQFSGADFEIEIIGDIKAVGGSVEFYARAWTPQGNPVGFGKDGSVEIERFIIHNPPVLVDDPNGEIVREWEEKDISTGIKTPKQRKLREDPQEALLQSLAHTIGIIAKDGKNIVVGKVGNTTSTFYPAAGANEPVDGMVEDDANNLLWANLIAEPGSAADVTTAAGHAWFFHATESNTNYWYYLKRSIFLFDTDTIGTDTIDSAIFSLYGRAKADPTSNAPTTNVYSSNPASTNNLVAGDFDSLGSTAYCDTAVTYANWDEGGYNSFTFNSTGKSAISKSGITKLGVRNANYDVAATAPTWQTNYASTYVGAFFADETGTTKDPKLVVEHAAATSIKTVCGLARASVKTIRGLVMASVKSINGLG